MIIDSHQHFWRLSRGDYGWLTPDKAALFRDFMPPDLAPHLGECGVDGTILVQAAPTIAETEFLLSLARETPFVLGVVGWVDFEAPDAPTTIARLAQDTKLVGLRPMIQDISRDDWMLDPRLAPAFDAMQERDLTFDALVLPRHLPFLRKLLRRYPEMRCVIDHGAKPEIALGRIDAWAGDMAALAAESGAFCKLSGLLTEAGAGWTPPDLAPYINQLLARFGAPRLLWGSDWPVLTATASYADWYTLARSAMPDENARAMVFGDTARAAYKLSV